MIDKIEITKKLTQFFKRTKIDSFFKIIIVSIWTDVHSSKKPSDPKCLLIFLDELVLS